MQQQVAGEQTKRMHCTQLLSASSSARESLHVAKREAAHITSIWVFGICVGVSSGKGGIRQPLCRQLPYESSHPKRDI